MGKNVAITGKKKIGRSTVNAGQLCPRGIGVTAALGLVVTGCTGMSSGPRDHVWVLNARATQTGNQTAACERHSRDHFHIVPPSGRQLTH